MSDVGTAAPTAAQRVAFARSEPLRAARTEQPALHVSGGPDSVSAQLESLEAAASALHRVAGVLDDAADDVLAAARAATSAIAAERFPGAPSRPLDHLVGAVTPPLDDRVATATGAGRTGLAGCSSELTGTARDLRLTAARYGATDGEALGWFARGAVEPFLASPAGLGLRIDALVGLGAALPSLMGLVAHAGDSGGLQAGTQSSSSLLGDVASSRLAQPGVAAVGVLLAGTAGGRASAVRRAAGLVVDVGRARGQVGGDRARVVEVPAGHGGAPTTSARSVTELLRRSEAVTPEVAGPATLLVQRTVRADGTRVATVFIPGTQRWSTGGVDPYDQQTNLEEVAGRPSAATDAVTQALARAGVTADEPLLLVGHSQGGITATALAGDPAFRQRFNPTAVVTAGSPVAGQHVPEHVHVLALEHSDELVPHLDGAPNAASPGVTTVTSATPLVPDPLTGQPLGPHDTATYTATARQVDASHDPRITTARASLEPFLQDGGTTTSTMWKASRIETVPHPAHGSSHAAVVPSPRRSLTPTPVR